MTAKVTFFITISMFCLAFLFTVTTRAGQKMAPFRALQSLSSSPNLTK
jgi:hypothetical protein